MDLKIFTSLSSGFLLFLQLDVIYSSKWSYKGDTGPAHWHELFPEKCSGRLQSPININPEETVYNPRLRDFAIWYDPPRGDARMYVKNNGHAVQVDTVGDFFFSNGGLPNVYKTAQFHFHWGHKDHHGSEHHIEGQPHPLEITDEDNKVLNPIIKAMEKVRNPDEDNLVEIQAVSLRDLLPDDISRYFRYNGSLTTPGCFESVVWTVFERRQKISLDQLLMFRKVLKPKHKRHKHRRHLKRSTAERNAEHVIDELGIRGNHMEEGELRKEMLEMKMDEIAEAPLELTTMTPSLDEDSAKRAEENMARHAKEKQAEEEMTHKEHKADVPVGRTEEVVYIQEHLVNNFRPIQPINDRLIQRSFKLGEIVIEHDGQRPPSYNIPNPKEARSKENSATQEQYSLLLYLLASFTYICFKL